MKVKISYIEPEKTERAELYVVRGHQSLETLVQVIEKESYKEKVLYVTDKDEKYQISFTHIFFIESIGEKILVHTEKKVFQCKKRLYELEKELPEYFSRISKSVILNLRQVEYYRPQLNGIMKANLYNREEVYISRKYLREIRSKIGG